MKRILIISAVLLAMMMPAVVYAAHIQHHGCEPCHTPHHSPMEENMGVALWSGAATTKEFTLYQSPSGSSVAVLSQPDGSSKLCLSCHDGSNGYIGRIVDGHTVPSNFENDLSNSHPISFDYAAVQAQKPDEYVAVELIPAGYLDSGRVQCSSCHDIHDGEGIGEAELRGFDYVDGPGGGGLCQVCHNKG